MCTALLPTDINPIAVKCIVSYHISYRIISYIISNRIISYIISHYIISYHISYRVIYIVSYHIPYHITYNISDIVSIAASLLSRISISPLTTILISNILMTLFQLHILHLHNVEWNGYNKKW
jgi:hypothetical protein